MVIKVLIIIPAYNEAGSIKAVVDTLIQNYPQYDYVVVNDGSTDNTLQICRDCQFNYLDLPINLGIGGAVQTGYLYAKENNYDIAVQLDGDGQHNPEYIERLIAPIIKQEVHMVIGSRFLNKKGFQTSFLRRMGILFLKVVIRLCCGLRLSDVTSGFRAASKPLIVLFSQNYALDYPEPEAIVTSSVNGFSVVEVPVEMNARTAGKSTITAGHSVYYMIKVSLALLISRLNGKAHWRK